MPGRRDFEKSHFAPQLCLIGWEWAQGACHACPTPPQMHLRPSQSVQPVHLAAATCYAAIDVAAWWGVHDNKIDIYEPALWHTLPHCGHILQQLHSSGLCEFVCICRALLGQPSKPNATMSDLPADVHGTHRTWHYELPKKKSAAADGAPSSPRAHSPVAATGSLDVILFYKYVELDAKAISEWQRELCESLELTGRVLVGPEGVNGTLAGTPDNIEAYVAAMDAHVSFGGVDWKHSEARDDPFPDLHIKIVKEIISTGGVIPNDFSNAGKHLPPSEFHQKLVEATPEDSVILDVRNYKEYRCVGGCGCAAGPGSNLGLEASSENSRGTHSCCCVAVLPCCRVFVGVGVVHTGLHLQCWSL